MKTAKLCERCALAHECGQPEFVTVCLCRKYAPLAPRLDRESTLIDEADAQRQAAVNRVRL